MSSTEVGAELGVELDVEGPAAPPRSNGELVFAEPWESRVFGVALSLHQAGIFEWSDFQRELIAAIARDEASRDPEPAGSGGTMQPAYSYYRCWLQALEALLTSLGLVDPAQLRERLAVQLARPAGHDHGHDHGSDHSHG
jgi:nitrile hydratase accessory protein